jgi:hypothetical protein
MNLKCTYPTSKYLQDTLLWILLILSLVFLNYSEVIAQCNCDDELVTTTSVGGSEGFESYTTNTSLPIGGRWSLFPSSVGYNPIAGTVVSSPANCGTKSLRFQFNGTPIDMRYLIENKRTSFKMYVPAGKGGTYSLLAGNGTLTILSLEFSNGNCTVNNGESFSYPQGSWFRISTLRQGNSIYIFRNYDHVSTFGTITEPSYANFDANSTNEQFYIDKLCTYFTNGSSVNCTQQVAPVCLYQSGIEAGTNICYAKSLGFIDQEFSLCNSGGFSPCDGAMTISCGSTVSGTTLGENFKFYRPDYSSCFSNNNSNDYRAPDKVYKFTHTGGDVQIHLWTATPNIDLDIFLLDECGTAWSGNPEVVIINIPPNTNNPNIQCIGRGISYIDPSGYDTDYIYAKDLAAGTYYIVVDGQHWQQAGFSNDAGNFDLSLHCKDLACNTSSIIKCGEKLTNQSNSSGLNNVSIYCSPPPNTGGSAFPLPPGTGCTGRERVYKFTPDVNGEVELNVTKIDANENFDVFVLLSCDQTNCLATGTNTYGQSEFVTFDGEKGREYIIVVDGFQETTGSFDIEIKCGKKVFCDACMQCFKYRPRFNVSQTIEFFSGWCDSQAPTKGLAYTNTWSVDNTAVTYLDNTSNTSIDPIMVFPGSGKYRVCQKIYNGTVLLYECCQWVEINPCTSEPRAFFTASQNSNDGTFTLNASQSQNADNSQWQFSESGVNYTSGNETSKNVQISIPNGKCINVCFNAYNGCGTSSYCITICRNNSSCTGSVPPVLFNALPQPTLDGRKVTYTVPQITNAEYTWDPGDGTGTKSGREISHTYSKDGNYIVCLRVIIGCRVYCYCWCVRPRICPPPFELPQGTVSYKYTGNTSDQNYTINTQNFTVSQNDSWLLDGVELANSKGKSGMIIPLPIDRDYTICIPYVKANGCLAYKCIRIKGGNPFNCSSISWKYLPNQGYQFQLPSGNTEIEWTVDETGQSLGSSATSLIIPPPSNCFYRTISVKYFDGVRYIICCLRIYICNPVNCRTSIKYTQESGQAKFELTETGASNAQWFFDDEANNTLGSNSIVILPYPVNCVAKTISVRFKDSSGNWRICCLVIYWCNPTKCENSITLTPSGNKTILSTQSSYQEIEWFVDNTFLGQGNNYSASLPINGQNVYVKYLDPATGCIYICCKKLAPPANSLIVDIGDNFCGAKGTEVLVPVTVKNYKKVASIQFDIASSNLEVAEIINAQDFHPNSGILASDFTLLSDQTLRFFTSSLTEINLNDNALLFNLKVRIKGNENTSAIINIQGDIKAYDLNVNEIPVTTSNGSVCSNNSKLSVSGSVKNKNGKALGTNGTEIPYILLTQNNANFGIPTDLNGDYIATNLEANKSYDFAPTYNDNLLKGIDVADLLILRKHMQGLTLFNSPLTYYAADLNDDKLIDVADLLTLRKIMQSLTTVLPNDRKAWKFVPNAHVFPNTINPLLPSVPSSIVFNPLTSNQINQNFTGVKRGDLNHSAIPLNDDLIVNRSADMKLTIQNANGQTNQEVYVDVTAENFADILGLGFTIEWPTSMLQLVSVPSGSDIKLSGTTLFNESLLNQGKLGLFWESSDLTNGTTLSNGSVIYRFKFKILANNGQTVTINGANNPVLSKYILSDLKEVPLSITSGKVTVGTSSTSDPNETLIKLYPNPSTHILNIESSLDIQVVDFVDALGRIVLSSKESQKINVSDLPTAYYNVRIQHQNGVTTKRILVVH